MGRFIKGKDGKFAGSIGDGKTDVPSPSDVPSLDADDTSDAPPVDYAGLHDAWSRQHGETVPSVDLAEATKTAERLIRPPFIVMGSPIHIIEDSLLRETEADRWLASEPSSGEIRDTLRALRTMEFPKAETRKDHYREAHWRASMKALWESDRLSPEDRGALVKEFRPEIYNDGSVHPHPRAEAWVADPRTPESAAREVLLTQPWMATGALRHPRLDSVISNDDARALLQSESVSAGVYGYKRLSATGAATAEDAETLLARMHGSPYSHERDAEDVVNVLVSTNAPISQAAWSNAISSSEAVTFALCRNDRTPAPVLELLALSDIQQVRDRVMDHPNSSDAAKAAAVLKGVTPPEERRPKPREMVTAKPGRLRTGWFR